MVELYEIRPKPGYTWEDLMRDGVDFKNAEIVKVVNGVVVEKYPYTPTIFKLIKPLYPKEVFQDIAIYHLGRIEPLEVQLAEEDMFRSGCNPFKQAIYKIVKERQPITPDDVITIILKEWKILKDTKANYKWLEGLIAWMTREQYLTYIPPTLKTGLRRLQLGSIMIQIRKSYNPILYEMVNVIELRRTMSKDELSRYFITTLNWIENDPVTGKSALELLNYYINYLLKNRYIEEVKPDVYKVIKPLEPY